MLFRRFPLFCATALIAAAQGPGFEVVSVKPSPPDAKFSQTTYNPGSVIAKGVNLKQLIEWAYEVTDVQVSGGPGWRDSRFFDFEAKAEGTHTRDELLRMLQPVLAERFKLALHRETKEMTVQVLTASGSSAALHPVQGGPANVRSRRNRETWRMKLCSRSSGNRHQHGISRTTSRKSSEL